MRHLSWSHSCLVIKSPLNWCLNGWCTAAAILGYQACLWHAPCAVWLGRAGTMLYAGQSLVCLCLTALDPNSLLSFSDKAAHCLPLAIEFQKDPRSSLLQGCASHLLPPDLIELSLVLSGSCFIAGSDAWPVSLSVPCHLATHLLFWWPQPASNTLNWMFLEVVSLSRERYNRDCCSFCVCANLFELAT